MTGQGDPAAIQIFGITWPEVQPGDDLTELLLDSVGSSPASADRADGAHPNTPLVDGDIVAVTSKVVSKAEARQVTGERMDAVHREAVRVLARRGDAVIAETRHGLVLAAAGVDSSNVAPGSALLLPMEPDTTAQL